MKDRTPPDHLVGWLVAFLGGVLFWLIVFSVLYA